MISVLQIVHDTMVDGPGFRTSVYSAGCPHGCKGCHNPQSWDIHGGTMRSTADILDEILSDPFANVTFTGGDPMFQAEGFLELAKAIRQHSDKKIGRAPSELQSRQYLVCRLLLEKKKKTK